MTTMTVTAPNGGPGARVTSVRRWAYPSTGGRDRRLDLLRGYAIAAMSINHLGLSQSYFHSVSGRSSFLISAAEAFLFISGFTLGFITIGRTAEQATTRLAKRTWTVYLATIGISLSLGLAAMTTHLQLWGELDAESFPGVGAWIGQVLTMRTAFNGADILVTYVLYLTAAIAALRMMANGRSQIVIAATAGVYLLSQLVGSDNLALDFASFRALAPNAPLFFGGLIMGFHREKIAVLWNRLPARRFVDAAVLVTAVGLGWLHLRGWPVLAGLGRRIAGEETSEALGLREFEMPLLPLAVVFLYLRAAWLIADRLWEPIHRLLGWFLLPLGEASLFAFTAHLFAIPLVVNLPWWPGEDIGRTTATIWVALYLAIIFGATRVRHRALNWLRVEREPRIRIRRHGAVAFVVALLTLAVAVGTTEPVGASGPWSQDECCEDFDDEDEGYEDEDEDFDDE